MIIDVIFAGGKQVNALVNGFTVKTDQDPKSGGEGSSPDPFTLFLSSIATCAGIYTKSFCDQREIPANEISLRMETSFDHEVKMVTHIHIGIHVSHAFPEKYESALLHAVGLCTVKRHLSDKILVETTLLR